MARNAWRTEGRVTRSYDVVDGKKVLQKKFLSWENFRKVFKLKRPKRARDEKNA